MVRAFAHGAMGGRVNPIELFLVPASAPRLAVVCVILCRMMYIKDPLLLIGNSSPCGSIGFLLSLSEWSCTICLTPYNRKYNMLSSLLNSLSIKVPM